jgi:hypothetical protein
MPDNRRSDPFVGEGKVNVGRIAAVEFEDGPHRGTHLLALHVGGVTGHAQSANSHEGRDHCVIPAGAGGSAVGQKPTRYVRDTPDVEKDNHASRSPLALILPPDLLPRLINQFEKLIWIMQA